jgi:hypothetical protein
MRLRLTALTLIVALLGALIAPLSAAGSPATAGSADLAGAALQAADSFTDVPPSHPSHQAITWLAQRGIVKGYGDGRFGPEDPIVRAQVAAVIARAVGWAFESWFNPFPDRGAVDEELWREVGALNHYGVARGFPDGTFKPTADVVKAQMISFIARAMVAKGYWVQQPDNAALYQNVPATSGHREDLATYRHYAGPIEGTPGDTSFPGWDAPATRAWVAEVLQQALATMPAVAVPVSGSGSFSGIFNITQFVPLGTTGIAAVGNILNSAGQVVASGIQMPVDLAATAAANQAALAQGELTAAQVCQILRLVLGPLDLNLLGLRIQLNQVTLLITAVPGPGNLLGNLLCAVANLLNPPGPLAQLLTELNNLIAELNRLGLGNLAATAPATVSGAMLIDSFTRSGDQLLANGTLAGQPLSLPVNLAGSQVGGAAAPGELAAAQVCQILNLDLGPLDLNLLGLRIQLSRVLLNITAVPGPGNLLGNLLCAIAGLLNPPSPLAQLLDLLNNLLRSV